jgi:hypothetical protein
MKAYETTTVYNLDLVWSDHGLPGFREIKLDQKSMASNDDLEQYDWFPAISYNSAKKC